MKFKGLLEDILLEANKKDVLMRKIGFSESVADLLVKLCGSLAVWMGNKILDVSIKIHGKSLNSSDARAKGVHQLNTGRFLVEQRSNIQSVMDWIRVGLNSNLGQYKDLPYTDLVVEASNWHNSLEIGGGEINYVEGESNTFRF